MLRFRAFSSNSLRSVAAAQERQKSRSDWRHIAFDRSKNGRAGALEMFTWHRNERICGQWELSAYERFERNHSIILPSIEYYMVTVFFFHFAFFPLVLWTLFAWPHCTRSMGCQSIFVIYCGAESTVHGEWIMDRGQCVMSRQFLNKVNIKCECINDINSTIGTNIERKKHAGHTQHNDTTTAAMEHSHLIIIRRAMWWY